MSKTKGGLKLKSLTKYFGLAVLLLWVLSSSKVASQTATSGILTSIDIQKSETELKVQIDLEGDFAYQTFEMNNPSRLVIEFSPVTKVMTDPSYEVHAFGVEVIRTAQYQPQVARIVFDLSDPLPFYKIAQEAKQITATFWLKEEAAEKKAELKEAEKPKEEAAIEEIDHLKNISFEKVNDEIKFKIDLEGNAQLQNVFTQESKLILEFSPVEKISTLPSLDVNQSGLKSVTVEKVEPQSARVSFIFSDTLPTYTIKPSEKQFEVVFGGGPVKVAVKKKEITTPVEKEEVVLPKLDNTMIGFTAGSYNMSSEDFTQIYGSGGFIWGLDLSRILYTSKNLNLGLGLEGKYFSKTGASTVTKEETKFRMYPLSLSARLLLQVNDFVPYLGLGPDYYYYQEESTVGDTIQKTQGKAWGYHIQGGIYYQFPGLEHLKVKLFMKFTKITAEKHGIKQDLGGMEFGTTLCFGFNFPK
jgi:hypothetical protein